MNRTTLCSGVLTLGAAALFALLFGCDDHSKKVITPPITPKFLYASSCGSVPGFRQTHRHQVHPARITPDGVSGTVSGFSVDATTGALTPLAGTPVASGLSCPEFLTVDPSQQFIFVPDEGDSVIHSYAIGADGTLTEVGTPASQCAFQLAVDPSGKFLVAPDFCTHSVDVYSIAADGSLTPVLGSPFLETTSNFPQSAWIDPAGKFVYVTDVNDGPGTITVFSLSSTGALTEISGSPFTGGTFSFAISGTADGKYLYINDEAGGNQIDGFSINATTGALTPLSTPSFAGGDCWTSVDATGTVVFTTDCSGNVFSSLINADGTLTAATGSPVNPGSEPWQVIGDPSGKFVYAGDDNDTTQIFAYSYSSAGVLTAVTDSPFVPVGTFIEGMVITH